jgi:hypothetical protein
MLPFVNGKRKENVKKYRRCRGERELQTKKNEKKYSVVTEFLMQHRSFYSLKAKFAKVNIA